jgi:hypothetical protein
MGDTGPDRNGIRNVGDGRHGPGRGLTPDSTGAPTDVGRTSGGGSLGHQQPAEVEEDTNVRNQPGQRPDSRSPND